MKEVKINSLEQQLWYAEQASVLAEKGILFFTQDFNADAYASFCINFTYLNEKNKDITVILNSPGGEESYMFSMYDMIQSAKRPVTVIGTGEICSAGVLILAGGHNRYVTENSVLMSHQGSFEQSGTASELIDRTKWVKWSEKRWAELMARHTPKTVRQWQNITKRKSEFWVLGGDAIVKEGIADGVVR